MKVIDKSKQQIDGIISKSREHYKSANETYFEHMRVAIKVSFELLSASFMASVHAIIPAIFQKGASTKILKLYDFLQSKKRIDK